MKWLKNISKWLKPDEEYEIEEIIIDDSESLDIDKLKKQGIRVTTEKDSKYLKNKQIEPSAQQSTQPRKAERLDGPYRHSDEINAEVSFQYPKGNFRFPVIPDRSLVKEKKRREEARSNPREPRREKYPPLEREPRERRVHIPAAATKKPARPNVTADIEKKRPFKLSDIPSPVYGFQKRPVKNRQTVYTVEESRTDILSEKDGIDVPAFLRKEQKMNSMNRTAAFTDPVDRKHTEEASAPGQPAEKESANEKDVAESNTWHMQQAEKHTEEASVPGQPAEKESAIEKDVAESNTWHMQQAEKHTEEASVPGQPAERESTIEQDFAETDNGPLQHTGTASEERHGLIKEKTAGGHSWPEPGEQGFAEVEYGAYPDLGTPEDTIVEQEDTQTEPAFEKGLLDVHGSDSAATEDVQQVELPAATEWTSGEEEETPKATEFYEDTENETGAEYDEPASIEEPRKKCIPFNVLMLSKDKEKWETASKKKTVNKDTVQSHTLVEERSDMPGDEGHAEEDPFYQFPDKQLLSEPIKSESDQEWLRQQAVILNETLHNFNVRAKVVNATQGPAVTQFEVQPEPGVKVNKITNLADDIKLCLAARDIRMEAPIPGKHTIGIEIPNRNSRAVFLREILESKAFIENESPLTVALGLDITGTPIVTDLRKMPHGLIAGATGSGKSVCINTMLISLLYKATPQEVKLLLIDPKVVELAPYNSIPHLVSPVITDVKAATAALKWAVDEMERRYELFAHTGVRDISRFNQKAEESKQYNDKLPYILVVIDELADLMMMSPAEVEESICRIAQKARACGIHMIVATQRPSVDVITGLIKSNIPTRIAFSVSSQIDSRTIIDSSGAEKLLGRGDMLFMENGSSKTVRLQGTYVDDEEIEKIVGFVKMEQKPDYLFVQEDLLSKANIPDQMDDLFLEACEFVVYQNAASTSSLQRRFHIGYSRAGRIIDMMESNGIVSENRGSRPREVLMTAEEFEEWSRLERENVQ